MVNLLPDEKKEILKKEYHLRVFLAGSYFAVISLAILVVILGSYFFLVRQEIGKLEEGAGSKNASTTLAGDMVLVKEINQKLLLLNTRFESMLPTELARVFISYKNDNIKITRIEYQNKENVGYATVKGIARTRESVITLLEDLKQNQSFMNVDLPISDLSKSKDVPFTISLSIKKDEEKRINTDN